MTETEDLVVPSIPFGRALAVALIVLAGVSLVIMPRSHWEMDEFLFRQGIERFEPLRHHPHPPGYPALIGIGKAFSAVTGDPFTAMRAVAILSTLVGFAALAAAVARAAGSTTVGISASALFYFSCAQLVHSTTPMSDPPALAFLFVGLWAFGRARAGTKAAWPALVMGAAFAMSVGCRPQYCVAIVPGLLIALVMKRSWRYSALSLVSFALVCLTWFVPLVIATGGLRGFVDYEIGQAAYVAAHDAELSRAWMSKGQVWERFVERSWGGGAIWSAIQLLALAGLIVAVWRRMVGLIPLAVIASIHLAFTLATSDPTDGVRYALAFQPLVAVLAALGLAQLDRATSRNGPAFVLTAVFAATSLVYSWPIVGLRARGPSPPVRAAKWIADNVPRDAVILVDGSMEPHAATLLAGWNARPIESGVRDLWNMPETRLWVFANGRSADAGARIFEWDGDDHAAVEADRALEVNRTWTRVFKRLTRNHYGVVSVIPLTPDRRYLPGRGVFPIERSQQRAGWRWLAPTASLTIPAGRGAVTVTLHLPVEVPEDGVDVRILMGESILSEARIERTQSKALTFPFPDDGGDLTILSGTSFMPVEQGASDRRDLAVQLLSVERTMSVHGTSEEIP